METVYLLIVLIVHMPGTLQIQNGEEIIVEREVIREHYFWSGSVDEARKICRREKALFAQFKQVKAVSCEMREYERHAGKQIPF